MGRKEQRGSMTREETKRVLEFDLDHTHNNESKEALRMAIKALEHEQRWIPVSERLPELYTFVYATCHSLVDDREDWVIETCYMPIPKEYNSRRFSDWGNIPMLNHGKAEVIAWMERDIPEPYKAEREDKR